MKKLLITGANGMVGYALVKNFIGRYRLILVDKYTDKINEYKNVDTIDIVKCDLSEMNRWDDVLKDVYCVIHLAAVVHSVPKTDEEIKNYYNINLNATAKLYKYAQKNKIKKFLFFSTNDVYEPSEEMINEKILPSASSIYGQSKLLAERILLELSDNSHCKVCIFRPSSIYGVYDQGSMKTLVKFCKRGIVPIIGKGNNIKSLLYLKDVVCAVECYINTLDISNGEIFNISSGNLEYKQIINFICMSYNLKTIKVYIPKWICNKVLARIKILKKLVVVGQSKVIQYDKAEHELGYTSKYNLIDGLYDAKNYYL